MDFPSSTDHSDLLELVHRSLQCIWDGDTEAYRTLTAEDVSFYEWYISPQRIDGLDFHLREIAVHAQVLAGDTGQDRVRNSTAPHPAIRWHRYSLLYLARPSNQRSWGQTHIAQREPGLPQFRHSQRALWKLVHCHKSPIATPDSLTVLR